MLETFVSSLFLLVFGHALADYPLQNRFMALGKNPNNKSPENTSKCARKWYHKMSAHCFIHGGMVYFATGIVWFGLAEVILHWSIDIQKCNKRINADVDQGLHILCKIIYAMILIFLL